MKNIENLLIRLESKISFYEVRNQAISNSTLGWQIEHILLTINRIIGAIAKSDPQEYKWNFNFFRILVLNIKKIPRGKIKAPAVVQPNGDITIETLVTHLSKTRERIKVLQSLNKNNYFEHPYFGKLNTKQTINFLEIHTKHHLEIIEDIMK
jgi:hypothetical protein